MTTMVAGLPKYVVFRSKTVGKYIHYLWNDEFGEYYKDMGCKQEMDPVSPFVKMEVVPSTLDPNKFIHLRCSYNNKYLKLVSKHGMLWVSATGDEPVENVSESSSTLFEPVFLKDEGPNTLALLHEAKKHVCVFHNIGYDPDINGLVLVYHDSATRQNHLEFLPWVSYDEVVKGHEDELSKLKDLTVSACQSFGETVKVEDREILKLKSQMISDWTDYQKRLKIKDDQLQNLVDRILSAWNNETNK
ncbi:hypothetical protein LINPERHAP2_LOCUS41801 [Linum perenne]